MSEPLAYMVEREYDIGGDESGPARAALSRDFYCTSCASDEDCLSLESGAVPVYDKDLLYNPYVKECCCMCEKELL